MANLAEVAAKHVDIGLAGADLVDRTEGLGIRSYEVTREDVALQAAIRARDPGGRLGLSLGDRLCLALAMRLGLPVVTADPVWATVELPVTVTLIR